MCLAIAAQKARKIPEAHLRSGYAGNQDGAGFAYVNENGQVVVDKGYFDINEFVRKYNDAYTLYGEESPFLVHFRTATHGPRNRDNTHPFKGAYGAFVHNGIFSGMGDATRSDTQELADIIRTVPEEALPKLISKIKDEVGWSKVAFLGHSGQLYFIKEKEGTWENGIWYSNSGYRTGARDYGGRSFSHRSFYQGD